jgi:hypothetical protein
MSSLDAVHIVLVAFISTCAVELLKDLTPLRYAFNRWAVQRWLWRGLDLRPRPSSQAWAILTGKWLTASGISHLTVPEARPYAWLEQRVIDLAACGRLEAMYKPELAQIAGQLHLLTERLMDFPAQDPVVLRAIAGVSVVRTEKMHKEPDQDLNRLAELSDGFRAALASADAAEASSQRVPGASESTTSGELRSPPPMSASAGELIDTRTRVTAWVQGRLNELQTAGRTSWRIALSALAVGIGIAVFVVSQQGTWMDGVFAGLLTPITCELLGMLKRAGRP